MRRALLTLTALSLIALPALAQEAPPPPKPAMLEVIATADIRAVPDMATLSAGVITQADSASAALSKNTESMNKVIAALKALGIAAGDIQTSDLSIAPQYVYRENQSPTVTGYQASNNVTVRLTKLDSVGSVIDALVKEGANNINGPSFGIDKPDPLLDTARRDAVAKARARAELLASAAGMKLGRIVSISESTAGSFPPPMPMMRMEMAAQSAPTPVSPGQLNLSASVTMVFELAP